MSTQLTIDELAWVTGLPEDDLSSWQRSPTAVPPLAGQAIGLAQRLSPGSSTILRDRLTTYGRLSALVAAEADASFAVRLVRESVLDAATLVTPADIDAFHAPAPATGRHGWDALIAGVAMMTGLDNVSDPQMLAWCDDSSRYCEELFDPLGAGRWRWLDYLRTPIELQVRNVILASGNLEGV
jgi:hypothetical protein